MIDKILESDKRLDPQTISEITEVFNEVVESVVAERVAESVAKKEADLEAEFNEQVKKVEESLLSGIDKFVTESVEAFVNEKKTQFDALVESKKNLAQIESFKLFCESIEANPDLEISKQCKKLKKEIKNLHESLNSKDSELDSELATNESLLKEIAVLKNDLKDFKSKYKKLQESIDTEIDDDFITEADIASIAKKIKNPKTETKSETPKFISEDYSNF